MISTGEHYESLDGSGFSYYRIDINARSDDRVDHKGSSMFLHAVSFCQVS